MKLQILSKQKTMTTFLCCFFFVASFSCSSSENNLGLDSKAWKNDLNGCKGERLKLRSQVEELRLKLVGLKEWNIRKLLGKPDAEELMERSQKIYIYYITPGPKCAAAPAGQTSSITEALTVRMDALGTVREVNIFND
ncbi:hypothetical protein [Rufibacter sp. XAAS-G3-1]|uniref:hypothetical protein n=1 Tax=Rufibacter sp. XAAS-G3-1 TaxID=2729134 RepID=UPI0015E65C60|nr:hypothetical protein [Rufibacter sp. XAAS-G3-1]